MRRVVYNLAETKYFESSALTVTSGAGSDMQVQTGDGVPVTTAFKRASMLNQIAQGVGNTQRIGNRIHVKYIHLTIALGNNPSTNANVEASTCRYMVVHDLAANKSLMAAGDLFSSGVQVISGIAGTFNALKNVNNMKRFRFLLDRQHLMQVYSTASGSKTPQTCIQHYIPINRTFQYDGGTQDITTNGSLVSDAINFAIVASDNHDCCAVSVRWRIAFKDA